MPEIIYTPEACEAAEAAVRALAVPIRTLQYRKGRIGRTPFPRLPIVFVDARDRSDVANIERVHRVDRQNGYVRTRWGVFVHGLEITVALEVQFVEPVVCAFNLIFPTTKASTRYWLAQADSARCIGMTVEPPERTKGLGVLLQLGSTPLKELLIGAVGIVKAAEGWRWS